jgi:hypothetical protein
MYTTTPTTRHHIQSLPPVPAAGLKRNKVSDTVAESIQMLPLPSRDLLGYEVGILSAGFQPYLLRISGTATTATGPADIEYHDKNKLLGRETTS